MDNKVSLEQRHYAKIQNRLAIAFAVLAAVITVSFSFIIYIQARNNLYSQFKERVLSLVTMATLQQSPVLLSNIRKPTDQETAIYKSLQQANGRIVDSDPTLGSVYVMRQYEGGDIYFVLEAVSKEESKVRSPKKYGSLYRDPGPVLNASFATMSGPMVEDTFHTNTREWERGGTWLSAYAPIYTDDGTKEGILGLDMSAEAVLAAEKNMLISTIILLVITLPIFAILGWLVGGQLARPIVQLTKGVNRITAGELQYVVEVKSGDEIEALADSFNVMTSMVNELITGLESRVEERTRNLTMKTSELEEASRKLENRASQLTAVSVVARAVTTMRDASQLLPSITEVISQQFGYYHVGIFLNDASNQYSVLRSSNSDGGKRMLEKGHRLRIGQVGIVGYVASTGKARIALDTGEDAVFFNNPNLPATKSEMALPLKVGEKIIGVIDVQSTESGAFKQEDVEILSILADQVSIAIENARLFDDAQKSAVEAQSALRQYSHTDWSRLQKTRKNKGYHYSYRGVETLTSPVTLTEENPTVSEKALIRIPLTIHNEQIGTLGLLIPAEKSLSEDEMDIAKAIADRVALSVENARLFEETSSRAERERTVADISNKIRSTNDPEIMIQTAMVELQHALGASQVQILPYSSSPAKPAPTAVKKLRKSRTK
jgi:GAF domain-containing protein